MCSPLLRRLLGQLGDRVTAIDETSFTNRMRGDGGNDTLDGGLGADRLFGGMGKDKLLGGRDNDGMNGGIGDDTLDGGLGSERPWGDRCRGVPRDARGTRARRLSRGRQRDDRRDESGVERHVRVCRA